MRRKLTSVIALLLLAAIVAGSVFKGISSRTQALAQVTAETREMAVTTVSVAKPETGTPQESLTLPGTMQPLAEASINARTSGYLRKWYVDLGAHVRAGELLADVDTPEVDRQLDQARADLLTAEANARLAKSTAERYQDLITSDSVSKQDVDIAVGTLDARNAAVASAQANVRRLEQLHAFSRIEAPFDGVVTARNVDVGALVDSGGNARELFHIASTRTLRVFVQVPQVYSREAKPGAHADLTLKEFPGKHFVGTLVRTSQSIDVASRTLLAEFDVDNASGQLLPGSYCDVHLALATPASTLRVPVSALIFRADGLRVGRMNADDTVALTPVTLGRDFGTMVEITNGIEPTDRVIVNPPDSLSDGVHARVVADSPEPTGSSR